MFLLSRRRRQKRDHADETGALADEKTATAGGKPQRASGLSSDTPTVSEADGQPVSEVEGRPARPWSMRSELEGSPVAAHFGEFAKEIGTTGGRGAEFAAAPPAAPSTGAAGTGAVGGDGNLVPDGQGGLRPRNPGNGTLSPVAELPAGSVHGRG